MLELRYGLDGSDPRTLEEVGRAFGVTRERVRQIESRALMKLKSYRETKGPGARAVSSAVVLDCELVELLPDERIVFRWRVVTDRTDTVHTHKLVVDGLAATGFRRRDEDRPRSRAPASGPHRECRRGLGPGAQQARRSACRATERRRGSLG